MEFDDYKGNGPKLPPPKINKRSIPRGLKIPGIDGFVGEDDGLPSTFYSPNNHPNDMDMHYQPPSHAKESASPRHKKQKLSSVSHSSYYDHDLGLAISKFRKTGNATELDLFKQAMMKKEESEFRSKHLENVLEGIKKEIFTIASGGGAACEFFWRSTPYRDILNPRSRVLIPDRFVAIVIKYLKSIFMTKNGFTVDKMYGKLRIIWK